MYKLEEELTSCQLQTVDPENATVEEIVKDMHKMLVGNGGPTRGLIVKVAAANVHIKDLHDRVDLIDSSLNSQKKTCADFRTKHAIAKAEAEGAAAKRIVKVLWENRAVILVLLLAAVMYFATGWRNDSDEIKLKNKLNGVLEEKLEKLLDVKIKSLTPTETKDARDHDNRTSTRK